MLIKIECGCGTKYKFDVEPVNGRMPVCVQCPNCGNNGTTEANSYIARALGIASPTTAPAPVLAPIATPEATAVSTPPTLARATAAPAAARYESLAPASLLDRNLFFIKERASLLKLTDTYDILDPGSGQVIGIAKEEPPGWAKWLRLAVEKSKLPTAINIYEDESQPPVVNVKRGFTFLRQKLPVTGPGGRSLGYFRSKLISLGGGFLVFNTQDQQIAEVKGDWKGKNFRFLNKHGREVGTVTKKWAGLGKELFSSADNYVVSLTDPSADADTAALLLAAGICIDVVFKEKD